jgi:hypothetical protein
VLFLREDPLRRTHSLADDSEDPQAEIDVAEVQAEA